MVTVERFLVSPPKAFRATRARAAALQTQPRPPHPLLLLLPALHGPAQVTVLTVRNQLQPGVPPPQLGRGALEHEFLGPR
jgi:hypothetical protein